jgi:class 3 adenylate cyclase/predicted ATPase
VKCSACGASNEADAVFCEACGTSFGRECPSCGTGCSPSAKFCRKCRTPLGGDAVAKASERDPRSYTPKHLAEKILTSRSALEGERKQVTVLFADVKGSMDLAEQVDPEEWHRIMDRFFAILSEGVHRFEGTINQYTGDGIMALFGAPIAHEDHARNACYAALHLRDELSRYADDLHRNAALDFSVRMGMNSGEVVVGKIGDDLRMDYTAQGHTVGLAARMEQLAEPGRIYLTEQTAKLVSGFFRLDDLGPFDVKGVGAPVRAYELEGVSALHTAIEVSRSRGFSRFVGRADEMAVLDAALGRAIEGNGQVVGVVAHPGLGKSRLCFEFAERCQARGIAVYEAHGISHGKLIPFLPILELFRAFFRITEQDGAEAAREKIAGRMLLLDEALRDALPLVFDFLGVPDPERPVPQMDPEQRLRQLFAIVKRVTQARSRREPAVVLLEDLHWFDGGSDAVLEVMVEVAEGTRTLIVVNFRPEYHAGWMQKSYYQQMPLLPLGPEAIAELLRDLLGTDPSVASLGGRIRERTAGNPFFIEEMVQTLAETGSLAGAKGAYRLVRPAAELALPTTVQAVLAARIDRLAEREKQVLETAAVIGREFTEPVLRRVVELSEIDLTAALQKLRSAEFVYEEALHPQAQYTFKHALTREVAYNSLLNERRLTLHEHVGEAIEGIFAGRLDEHFSELAHQYSKSRNTEKAIEYSRLAGERAVRLSVNVEAISHLTRGLELLKTLPDTPGRAQQELALQIALGVPLRAVRGLAAREVGRAYARARELCQQVGGTPEIAPVLWGLWEFYELRAEYRTAFELGEQLLRLAERVQDPALLLAAHDAMGDTSFWVGEFPAAREHLEHGVRLYDVERHRSHAFLYGYDSGVACLCFGAYALWFLGYPDQALRRVGEALTLARGLDHTFSLAFALHFSAQLHHYRRESQVARDRSAEVLRISTEQNFPIWLGCAEVVHGWALAETGQAQEGLTQIRQGIADWRASGHELEVPHFLGLLAEAHGRANQPEEGLNLLTEALAIVERSGERFWEAELRRMCGEQSLRVAAPTTQGRPALVSAEESFQRAIEIARRQHAKSLELRAVMSLSRWWRDQGRKNEARQVLAEIYGWFTEGFDTADLKEAKALLEELS